MKAKEFIKGLFCHRNNTNKGFSMKQFTDQEFERLKAINKDEKVSKETFINEIGVSFSKIRDKAESEKYLNTVLGSFVMFCAKKADDIPYSMLEYINRDNYRTLFDYVKNWSNRELKKDADERISLLAVKVICDHILSFIDENDIPALMQMGMICKSEKDYPKAQEYFKRIISLPGGYNGITALADCYNDEVCELAKMNKGPERDPQISEHIFEINSKLEQLFIDAISDMEEMIKNGSMSDKELNDLKTRYVSLSCKYARLQKKRGRFDMSMNILDSIPADYNEYFRVLLEKGLLYQYISKPAESNRYFDLERSIETLRSANEMLKGMSIKGNLNSVKKSILMPLANSLFMAGDYSESMKICETVLELDKYEKNAKQLMNRIKKRSLSA